MNCEELELHIAEYLSGALQDRRLKEFETHVDGCGACRAEAAELRSVWERLGLVEAPAPGRAMRTRFYEALEAYTHGLEAARRPERGWHWLPRPAFRFAWAAALLLAGVGTGYLLNPGGRTENPEVAGLRDEVRSMRQTVALALLDQPSPSDRLLGVGWGARVESPDAQVLSALLHTLDHDSNVNVRLAAVDALGKFAAAGMVRGALERSMAKQESPLVQIALIDLMVGLRERQAAQSIRALAAGGDVNPAVRQRAEWGLRQLE
jgi:hypothetical protein